MTLNALYMFFSVKFIPLLSAIIGFSALIAIHEFGHFLFCKLFGIHTPTFSIGFGPELFCKKIGTTNFRLAAIPLGGYVEIAGLAEIGQGEQEFAHATDTTSFDNKPYWQKVLVLLGGILFNLLFAYIVFSTLFMIGSSDPQAIMVSGIVKDSAAQKYGLTPGDAIIQINDINLKNDAETLIPDAHRVLLETIQKNPNKEVRFVVERDKQPRELLITLGERTEQGEIIGSLGAELRTPIQKQPFLQAIKMGIQETNRWIFVIIKSIKNLITQRSLEGAGGPVMIMSMSFGAAQQGMLTFLTFLALISINLALLNVLPIGALDGGQLFFVTIEAIIGRKLPLLLRNGINLISWIFFIGLALFLTYKDLAYLFGDKIIGLYKKLLGLVR